MTEKAEQLCSEYHQVFELLKNDEERILEVENAIRQRVQEHVTAFLTVATAITNTNGGGGGGTTRRTSFQRPDR